MKMRKAPHSETGFTLLEVLISVIVLSFGVLGMVGLQAASLQANRDARSQSSAVRLARELADMMRGNKNVAIQTTASGNPYLFDTASGNYPSQPQDCFVVTCTTATNVASYEMNEWLSRVKGTTAAPGELPGARVVVCFDSNPYTATGTPKWPCDGAGTLSVVKMGWTRQSTDRSAKDANALVQAVTPTVVLPLIAGS